MLRTFVILGAINLLISVALGAFGAHGLKDIVTVDRLATWETGVHYHMIHGLGLLLLAAFADKLTTAQKLLRWSGRLLMAGIVLFSGSLYLLVLLDLPILGAITPLGGVCFLIGWLCLAFAAAKQQR
ncbi:DUF423 domain-containing protein [Tumebacillus sp. DT12]|uniref:DUF423 domain-containing protein n=1 Tax=Tumebacillus lacus TaxID=2995335 RepID=A0ABT3X1M6_9BACL|nr:DUF423 domain-containing protein [Tumebacillus lacus]MCX7569677.1 DUF423 domain-containing protein [Tumebacillus lacus]